METNLNEIDVGESIFVEEQYWIFDTKNNSFIKLKGSKKYVWMKPWHAQNAFSYEMQRHLPYWTPSSCKFIENNPRYQIRKFWKVNIASQD